MKTLGIIAILAPGRKRNFLSQKHAFYMKKLKISKIMWFSAKFRDFQEFCEKLAFLPLSLGRRMEENGGIPPFPWN